MLYNDSMSETEEIRRVPSAPPAMTLEGAEWQRTEIFDGLSFILKQADHLPNPGESISYSQGILQSELFNALASYSAHFSKSRTNIENGLSLRAPKEFDMSPSQRISATFQHIAHAVGNPRFRFQDKFKKQLEGTTYAAIATDSKDIVRLESDFVGMITCLQREISDITKMIERDEKNLLISRASVQYYLYRTIAVATELFVHNDDIRHAGSREKVPDFIEQTERTEAGVGELFSNIVAKFIATRYHHESQNAVQERVQKIRGFQASIDSQGGPGRRTADIQAFKMAIEELHGPFTVKHEAVFNAAGNIIG